MSRDEHIAWCKKRAMEYFNRGDLANAVTSMLSDMEKHPECKVNHVLGMLGIMYLAQRDTLGIKNFIEGFR